MAVHLMVYVGPCSVAEMACKFRAAGLTVTCEGTERVHLVKDAADVDEARAGVLRALRTKHGTAFGLTLRDCVYVRTVAAGEASFR